MRTHTKKNLEPSDENHNPFQAAEEAKVSLRWHIPNCLLNPQNISPRVISMWKRLPENRWIAVEFCSLGYMEELMKRLNSDQLFMSLRKSGRNATYTLHVEPEPENGIDEPLIAGFSIVRGKVTEVWTDENRTTEFTDLVISGKYNVWVDLIRNRMNAVDAFLSRSLLLKGETDEIFGPTVWMPPGPLFGVELPPAAARIIEVARTIPTEFHGTYVTQSIPP